MQLRAIRIDANQNAENLVIAGVAEEVDDFLMVGVDEWFGGEVVFVLG